MKKVFVSLCMTAAVAALSSCASTKNAASLSVLGGEWNEHRESVWQRRM